jgi:aminoglycoside 3-N-acetyltransferase
MSQHPPPESSSARLHTADSLLRDLAGLGVLAGDTLFIHSSFKSIGAIEGGAGAVIAAIERAVGSAGLVLMPSFNLVSGDRAKNWDHATTPATTGWLTEFFRQMPGTIRSDNYSHSVAARGAGAVEWVVGKHGETGMVSPWDKEPWGRSYGDNAPLLKMYRNDARILFLGTDYRSATFMHVIEVMHHDLRLRQNPNAEFAYINRQNLGAYWDATGFLRRGLVGDAECRLFSARYAIDLLLAEVRANPRSYHKWWPG